MSPDRILIIKLSAIGDVVHTLPCLNALRQKFSAAEIGWVAQQPAAQLLEGHPQLDRLFVFPRHVWKRSKLQFLAAAGPFIRELRRHEFEVAIDFQGLTKSGLIARFSGAKQRIGFGDADGKRELNGLFTNLKVRPAENQPHVIRRNLALLEPLGIRASGHDCVLPIDAAAETRIRDFWREHELDGAWRVVALYPGAGWVTKQWPLENFAQLGVKISKELKLPVLLVWGPGEEEMVHEIARQMQSGGVSVRGGTPATANAAAGGASKTQTDGAALLAPPTSLKQLVALIDRCGLFIAGDTGPLHVAAALGVPCIGIFGASDARRNHPLVDPNITFQNRDVPCVPCWKTECAHRPIHECLRSIKVAPVFAAARKLLEFD